MDKQHNDPAQDSWLDDILGKQQTAGDIGPDETAVASAGLTHPDDLEFERIIQEAIAQTWGEDPVTEQDPSNDPSSTQFFAPQQEPQPKPVEEKPKSAFIQKLRPKAKKGYGLLGIPHILSTIIWLVLIVAIGISLGRTAWLCAADLLALGKEGQEVTLTIDISDNMSDIAEKLEKAGMIRYPSLFKAFADLTGKGGNILSGTITFSEETVYDYNALINAMSYKGGSTVTVDVMIPEGYSCAQIFALLEEKSVCSAADLEAYAADGELDEYWFLKDVKRGHKYCLEGFLFPDTYEFYLEDEPRRVLEKFLDVFDYRFTERMSDKLKALNEKTGLGLSLREVIIMASIIEKEKAADAEGYTISSVFYNRLTHAASYPFLNSDATILYATDYYNAGELVTDAQINASPFNTYTQRGLPPSPIANPGLSSLDAALEPEDTSYYYFVLNKKTNRHVFARTYDEHQRNLLELGY